MDYTIDYMCEGLIDQDIYGCEHHPNDGKYVVPLGHHCENHAVVEMESKHMLCQNCADDVNNKDTSYHKRVTLIYPPLGKLGQRDIIERAVADMSEKE